MPLEQPQSIRTIFFDAGFTLLYPHPSTPEICQRICQQLDLHMAWAMKLQVTRRRSDPQCTQRCRRIACTG